MSLLSSYLVDQKKCLEDGTADDSDTIAIAHDDDLQLLKDVVSQSQIYTLSKPIMRVHRKP